MSVLVQASEVTCSIKCTCVGLCVPMRGRFLTVLIIFYLFIFVTASVLTDRKPAASSPGMKG